MNLKRGDKVMHAEYGYTLRVRGPVNKTTGTFTAYGVGNGGVWTAANFIRVRRNARKAVK